MGILQDHFASPLWLLLLLLLPGVHLLSRRSLAGLSKWRRAASVSIRALVVLLLVLSLAELRLVRRDDRLAVLYLVDVSASIPPEHRQAALEFVQRSSRLRDPVRGDWVGLIVFGKTAGIEVSPRPAELAFESLNTLIEKEATDIDSALRLAAAVFPEGPARRVVLLTDGNENRGRALEAARALREERIEIDVLPIFYSYPGEILLDKLVVDPEVHRGEPFDIRVVAESTRPSRATLRLFENGGQVYSGEVELKAGKNVFTLPRRLEVDGHYNYEALIEPLVRSDDAILQNNSVHGFTSIRGLPRILLVSPDPETDAPLLKALTDEGINLAAVRPEGLPGEIEEYLAYDAIILSNVPAHSLTEERMKMFESLVKAVGLGFVMVGGEDSFGAGGYQGTPLEEILPVSMEIQQKKVLPNGALAVVMHSCEINNGNFWAKETVKQAIRILSPRDYAGVLYYGNSGNETWLFPLTPVSQKGMMLNLLSNFTPGDMPDFQRIVGMAHTALKSTPASVRHIIVLSDGDPNAPTQSQIAAIRKDGITLSTICMGWHSTPATMKWMAKSGGGNYYELTDPNKLPSIFIREATTLRKSLISERDLKPIVRAGGSFLRGLDLDSMPILKGYVITTQKETADQELAAPPAEGDPTLDPILSSWSTGLGKAVAFTSDAGRRWGIHWLSWSDYRRFWGQTMRWVSRQSSSLGLRASRSVEGETGTLTLDAMDEAGGFLNGIVFDGAVVDPDYQRRAVDVRQSAPGRYRVDFPAGKKGTYLVNFRYERDGRTYQYSTGLSVPYSSEFRNLRTNEDLLRSLASASRGKVLDPGAPAEVFARDFDPARSPQDLWRDLLRAAALLFFADVLVRRVVIDFQKLAREAAARLRALVTRRPVARAPSDERMGALLRKKSEVREAAARRHYQAPEGAAATKLDEKFIAGAGAGPPPAPKEAPKAPPKSAVEATKPAEDSYTGRLLAAKKRAKEKRDQKPKE